MVLLIASILLSAHNIHSHGKIKELPELYLNVCVLELSEDFFPGMPKQVFVCLSLCYRGLDVDRIV